MRRSYNSELLRQATEPYPDILPRTFPFEAWVTNSRNVMYEEDGSVGLATFEYHGVYNVHWFFNVGGKPALNLAREMLDALFNDIGAEVVRGITRVDLRPARFMCRKLGLKSAGIITYPDGKDYEMFLLTKNEFNEGKK